MPLPYPLPGSRVVAQAIACISTRFCRISIWHQLAPLTLRQPLVAGLSTTGLFIVNERAGILNNIAALARSMPKSWHRSWLGLDKTGWSDYIKTKGRRIKRSSLVGSSLSLGFCKHYNLPTVGDLRKAIFALYGAKCARCPWTDPRALQLDHKHGNGSHERKRLSTYQIYKRVLAHPEDYQLLCANCNWLKRYENSER